MRLLYLILLFTTFAIALSYCNPSKIDAAIKLRKQTAAKELQLFQDSIVNQYLKEGAWKHEMYSKEWQDEIDNGLAIDPTIAYLWQQKAMPLFKQGKHELAMPLIDKAVLYNPSQWQEYRAFMKCVFAKTYQAAIDDFQDCKMKYGNLYVMDHSYDFYIALSYLQLNEFEQADSIYSDYLEEAISTQNTNVTHHLDLFYYGIAKYELAQYEEANRIFDLALASYPTFSDVQVYKADCLRKLGKPQEAEELLKIAEKNGRAGYTINEANSIYERYPYQIRWY